MKKENIKLFLIFISCFLCLTFAFLASCSYDTTEEEVKEKVGQVESAEIPLDPNGVASLTRNVYIVFDGSGSMGENPGDDCKGDQSFDTKIKGARWALKKFMEKVPPDVNIGLFVFDAGGYREVVQLGPNNHKKFLQAVENIRDGGNTPLGEAITHGTDELVKQYKKQLGYGEYSLVVVTDGQANGSISCEQAALYAAKFHIPIYTIGLCIGENHELRLYSISYRAADNFADLVKGLEEVVAESPVFDQVAFDSTGSK